MHTTMKYDHSEVTGEYVSQDGELYYKIANIHQMPDFFMSLVGAGNHWMFVSSNGALTAGRRNPDLALFPYAADDQISAAREYTGSTTLIRGKSRIWEPLASRGSNDAIRRNLYKTPLGTKLIFEEVNEQCQLTFRYRWAFSQRFGIVRTCSLLNSGPGSQTFELLDGVQNVLPYGVGSDFTMRFSNLANAYKKSELVAGSQIGLFYLSSIPTDRAEPSEGLKTTVAWQVGLNPAATLLSAEQLSAFRNGDSVNTEEDVRGKPGAYLVTQAIDLHAGESITWHLAADLAQDHADVVRLDDWLQSSSDPGAEIEQDIRASEQKFLQIVSSSDGLQCGENQRRVNRHLSNTVFNVMRGGIPLDSYSVDRDDFLKHVRHFNREAYQQHQATLEALPSELELPVLRDRLASCDDKHLTRLSMEYLPLAFSRRHGDPTRPWNRFSIELTSDDGRTNLDYQGNWRDIFQNWEALACSFPGFTTAMICRFVNATTADGYNPYRVTKSGFEWEEPAPEDPWSNIGYWGDHQIIYLLKLLEWSRRVAPESLDDLLATAVFTHANIPYRIKDFAAIKKDPRDTIEFDQELAARIGQRVGEVGGDGKLLHNQRGLIHYVTLLEKILTLSLAKLTNFIPDGGIWLNTQRPEWNDANNALVGNGLSMVTTCYLYRWFAFLEDWLSAVETDSFSVSVEVAQLFENIDRALQEHLSSPKTAMDASTRAMAVEALSRAGSDFRTNLYDAGLTGETVELSRQACLKLLRAARGALRTTIRNGKRDDGLYHAYNLLEWREDGLHIDHLYEMLEGQVAVLSAGLLKAAEVVELLDALRASALYREDQASYLLYPNRQLAQFLDKNTIPPAAIASNSLVQRLIDNDNSQILIRDIHGDLHFNGSFRNSADLRAAFDALGPEYERDVNEHGAQLCRVFDDIFGHRQFTGRSGTFFAYEGLGSIYWHMVSKLALAVSENLFWALDSKEPADIVERLRGHLEEIRQGIGAEKSPKEYGAFPSDPYSHTPENAGVKQPGMTGQVKEDVLARFAELGVHVQDGCLRFRLDLFDREELLDEESEFAFYDVAGQPQTISVPKSGFALTFCQVPITYQPGEKDTILIRYRDGKEETIEGTSLDKTLSGLLFQRTAAIERIDCRFKQLGES